MLLIRVYHFDILYYKNPLHSPHLSKGILSLLDVAELPKRKKTYTIKHVYITKNNAKIK